MNFVSRNITIFPVEICDKIYDYWKRPPLPKEPHPTADMIKMGLRVIEQFAFIRGFDVNELYNEEIDDDGMNDDLEDASHYLKIDCELLFNYDPRSVIFSKMGQITYDLNPPQQETFRWWKQFNKIYNKETGELILHNAKWGFIDEDDDDY